ncbi:MAG: hypothetical protein M5R40_08200 [Anaerolineae bacterium]|nr:hypothetical protein [Anaerolineae bacterium]
MVHKTVHSRMLQMLGAALLILSLSVATLPLRTRRWRKTSLNSLMRSLS